MKQYLVNGYEEIRQVKKENIELENQLEEEKKNKQLYEGALVTLSEFQQRDKDNKKEYYQENKDKMKKYAREYFQSHKDQINKRRRKMRKINPNYGR